MQTGSTHRCSDLCVRQQQTTRSESAQERKQVERWVEKIDLLDEKAKIGVEQRMRVGGKTR